MLVGTLSSRSGLARRQQSGASVPRRTLVLIAAAGLLTGLLLPVGTVLASVRPPPVTTAAAPAALTTTVTLAVESADPPHVAIPTYQFRIDVDDTGNPTQGSTMCFPASNPAYPDGCDWPSVHNFTGGSGGVDNLVTQGDQDILGSTGLDLPDGKYLISVVAADYKIGGAHFTVPLDGGLVTVQLQPDPLPLATLRVQIFEDTSTNGQFDPQVEGPPQVAAPSHHFKAHIADVLGEVTTDWFGNPLCAEYDGSGEYIPGTGGQCVDDDNDGIITIPNLGSNRYSVSVVPPDGETWIQTSTLEGALDWDTWAYEGYTGNDAEVLQNGAPIAAAQFGFIRPQASFSPPCASGCGTLEGEVWSTKSYLPPAGGDTDEGPVSRAWVALADLRLTDDQLVWAGQTDTAGKFTVTGVPPSTYQIAMFDAKQNLLLGVTTAVVNPSGTVDIGRFVLSHWFSELSGTVFYDTNSDGKQDPGEQGIAGFPLVLKSRDNSVVDAGSKVATTDGNGHYLFKQVYPYGYWTVLEAYNDLFYTTGVTYQADNGPETTRLGAGVDVSVLNQDGLSSRVDWGVRQYAPGTNGGIVGSVTYAVTRNELDPRLAATEDYENGIPGLVVSLSILVPCAAPPCSAEGYQLEPDGSYTKGQLLNTYVTEEFKRPIDCVARNAAGAPIYFPFMSETTGGHACIESPLMGNQIKTGPSESDPPDESEFTSVNGNYGFGDGCFRGTIDVSDPGFDPGAPVCEDGAGEPIDFEGLTPQDYIVSVAIPDDAFGRPKFQVLREEDINVFDGDQFEPAVPPPPCVGALHTVDVEGISPEGPDAVANPAFADGGGSPFEGQSRPFCDAKLVPVQNGKSIAPSFFFFASVPPPGRLYGAVVEDLALGTDPSEFYYGEKAGIPNAPIGVYDYSGALIVNTQADPNGYFEVILPSTRTFNCPLPAGPCPNVYKVVGNDPGQPGHPNPGYDPQYRTLESDWQMWPGVTLLADVALLPTAPVIEFPGSQVTHPPSCDLERDPDTGALLRPELFAVSKPYVLDSGSFTIEGQGFGSAGDVRLDGVGLPTTSWSDTDITVDVLATAAAGPHQLTVTNADSGLSTVNGLTFHVIDGSYTPDVLEVGPTQAYATVQAALDASDGQDALVVVYPNTPDTFTPLGDYYENIVIQSPVKLQGVGPGGVRDDGSHVLGSILSGLGFATNRADDWSDLVEGIRSGAGWDGPVDPVTNDLLVSDGEVILVLASDGEFGSGFTAAIDGFTVRNGNEFGVEGTFVQPNYPTQGGGIFVNAYASNLQITNNVLSGNGGAYAGAIRVGTPNVGDNHNDDLRIAHNRIVANGGSNLAGAIGLFNGTNGYEIDHNDICGNFSAEYGGGVSHYGLSAGTTDHPTSSIHDNRVWLNRSYDEGGGVIVSGEQQLNATPTLSPGSGPVDIVANYIQANLADDDGGGLRFLMAGNHPINVDNNIIANNASAHEGGGVALDDATDVRFFNNTVVRNLTTATAQTSDGNPVPAGLSDTGNSALLQATLPAGHADYSDPLLFNNIFWDNRAGTLVFTGTEFRVDGLGLGGPGDINLWDMGVVGPGNLHPTYSILNEATNSQIDASATNKIGTDPKLVSVYDLTVDFLPWRAGGTFIFNVLVTDDRPPGTLPGTLGDYHLDFAASSPAENAGTTSKGGIHAPADDIDGDTRPTGSYEMGADERNTVQTDSAPPDVSSPVATPNPANGSAPVLLTASADDAPSGNSDIAAAEWFEGADPGQGLGAPMDATDGTFDSPAEAIKASIAAIDVAARSNGTHTLNVRAKDSANNWSTPVTVALTVDKVGPTTSGASASPNPTVGATSVTLTANASDVSSGNSTVVAGEWYEGAAPPPGSGTPMSAADTSFNTSAEDLTATIAIGAWTPSDHTLYVRARDAAGNWGAATSTVLSVRSVLFADNFESGNLSAWTSVTRPAGLSVTAGAKHAGAYGMQAVISGAGTATYVTDGSPNNEPSYHARFYVNSTSTTTTGNSQHTIFSGFTGGNALLFQVQFRRKTGGNKWEFRATFSRPNGEATTDWYTLGNSPNNAWHAIEIAWTASATGSLSLYLDGILRRTLTGNTSTYRLEYVRLGPSAGVGSNQVGTEYYDDFVSTRTTYIGP